MHNFFFCNFLILQRTAGWAASQQPAPHYDGTRQGPCLTLGVGWEPDYDGTFSALLEFSNFLYFGNILLHSPPQNFPQIIN